MSSEYKEKKLSKRAVAALLISSMVLIPSVNGQALEYKNKTQVKSIMSNLKANSVQNSISIVDSKGDLECAYIEWKGLEKASGYNVYYKLTSESDSKYKKVDSELIRQYSSYFRADVLGIKEGSYNIKVVPIINGKEDESKAAVKSDLNVKSNVREGFAFSKESKNGTASGGYNDDGTVPSNAQIVYITKDTVNTVSLDVVTNSKGKTTKCTGIANILTARKKGMDNRPLIIRMIGEIKNTDIKGLNSNGYLELKGCSKITFEGVGKDATAYGWGLLIRGVNNVEVRNIGIMLFPDDAISLDTGNTNVWIHNNDIFYGTAGSDKDQAKGDGSTDVKGKSDYVTISYNHYYDSGKCSLCGMNDTENFHVTYHHNWFDHSDSRHPRIRVGTVHIYNNYFDGNSKYGVGITKGGSAFVEGNYFRNCKNPMLISRQGSDVYSNSKGTFSGEPGGMIKAYNNHVEGAKRLVYASDNSKEFDAYLALNRNEVVPSSFKTVEGNNTYNNFDTSSSMYNYKAESPEEAKENVKAYAGRVNGGDFSWQFTKADDDAYSVNQGLMNKIKCYSSDLIKFGEVSLNNGNDSSKQDKEIENTDKPKDKQEEKNNQQEDKNNQNNQNEQVNVGENLSSGMTTNLTNVEDSVFKAAVYVSPVGKSTGDGSYSNPLDLESAIKKVQEGKAKSILLKGGTYSFNHVITINNSGSADAYNVLKGCKGEKVVLDFSKEAYSTNTAINERGIQLNGNYWYVSNITIQGAADNGMMLSGSHNIIERCIFDGNRDTGLQISRRNSQVTNYSQWPSYNTILNCTSKNNCDPATYENADGFAAKLTCGDGNVFDGCISYNNSDDGWDLFAKAATGPIGIVTIRNCIAMRNGMTENGTTKSSCDGNGFKLGGSGVGTPHVIENCIAIENLHHGFTDNNNPSALKVRNCTAFDNNKEGNKNNFSLYRCKDAVVSNCISYTTNGTSDKYVNLNGDHIVLSNSNKWYKVSNVQAMDTGSSKDRGQVISKGVSATDFISTNIPAVGTDFDKLWRNADGTINTNGVAIISSNSEYSSFSKDGLAIGARFSKTNNLKSLTINIKNADIPENHKEENVKKPEPEKAPDSLKGDITLDVSGASSVISQTITSNIKITTKKSYDLSKLKIRYYFTGDKAQAFQGNIYGGISYTKAPWYVTLDNNNALLTINKMNKAVNNADSYAEITFKGQNKLDDTAALNINLNISKSDWSSFDQSNDYSYNDASKIIVYYDGTVISGTTF